MRISDWSSDVCSSDLALARAIVCEPKVILLDEPLAALDAGLRRQMQLFLKQTQRRIRTTFVFVTHDQDEAITMSEIGRASCRERVCQYVYISEVAVSLQKKTQSI